MPFRDLDVFETLAFRDFDPVRIPAFWDLSHFENLTFRTFAISTNSGFRQIWDFGCRNFNHRILTNSVFWLFTILAYSGLRLIRDFDHFGFRVVRGFVFCLFGILSGTAENYTLIHISYCSLSRSFCMTKSISWNYLKTFRSPSEKGRP